MPKSCEPSETLYVTVLHDPTDDFTGSKFPVTTFTETLARGYWPNGMKLQLDKQIILRGSTWEQRYVPGTYVVEGKRLQAV